MISIVWKLCWINYPTLWRSQTQRCKPWIQVNQTQPCLVILAGNHQDWSHALVNHLRGTTFPSKATIVPLTDSHAPSWLCQEENPGFDGFLVSPLSGDVLTSLVQSTLVRQTYLMN